MLDIWEEALEGMIVWMCEALTRSISSCLWTGKAQTGRAESRDLLMTSQGRRSCSRTLVGTSPPAWRLRHSGSSVSRWAIVAAWRCGDVTLRYLWGRGAPWFCPRTWAAWTGERRRLASRILGGRRGRRPARRAPTVGGCRVQSRWTPQRRHLPAVHHLGHPAWDHSQRETTYFFHGAAFS